MSSQTNDTLKLEIAHVLFTDIVGYSKLPMDQQTQVLRNLTNIVRATDEHRRAEQNNQIIRLPTGDGMALVFFGDAESAMRCAKEISLALRRTPDLKLRMGVHSGPVYRISDINTNMNVAGGGINMAQRVMDCGDADHILISKAVAETLGQLSTWADDIHDLGEAEVKHGVRVQVFNVYNAGYGNPNLPEKLRKSVPFAAAETRVENETATPHDAAVASVEAANEKKCVALLYKRNAQPDEHVLKLLEAELIKHGYDVFIDRHLSIGVEWAKEIERQVRTADAVVPLLSAASASSEMLTYEVQIAHEAAQKQNGKPRVLPVRVDFEGELPDPLAGILAPIQYFLWKNPQSDQQLVAELTRSLKNPTRAAEVDPKELRQPGGAVSLDSKFYIVRPTDDEFLSAIKRRDSIVLVKGARQMGKTSLLARGVQLARADGLAVVTTDFQKLNESHLKTIEEFFLAVSQMLFDQLDLDTEPEDAWNPRRGASINFERYIRREVLKKLDRPLVWAMDEVDRLLVCDFGSEVFGLFRSWHNERSLDPDSPWWNLTLSIVYATEPHLFITDPNQSPFNVGTKLELKDFTFEQVAELNRRCGAPLENDSEVARYYRLLGGHPYLVHRGLYEMTNRNLRLAAFEELAARDEGPFGDHLRRILVLLARDPALTDVVRAIVRGQPSPNADGFYRLRSAGLVEGDSSREARPRCQLYAAYLERHLL